MMRTSKTIRSFNLEVLLQKPQLSSRVRLQRSGAAFNSLAEKINQRTINSSSRVDIERVLERCVSMLSSQRAAITCRRTQKGTHGNANNIALFAF